jgi:hypothetical protein
LQGIIAYQDGKVWVQYNNVNYPSIPSFLYWATGYDFHDDISWQSSVTIDDQPFLYLREQITPIFHDYSLNARILSSYTDTDGSFVIEWLITNNGTMPLPNDTYLMYRCVLRDKCYIPNKHIGSIEVGDRQIISTRLPKYLISNGETKFRWKIESNEHTINNSNLFFKLE